MNPISKDNTIEELLAMVPSSGPIFENAGLDYCCGRSATLDQACLARGIKSEIILSLLQEKQGASHSLGTKSLADTLSPSELVDHIEKFHHAQLWKEFERLDELTAKVARVHGPNDARLGTVREVYLNLERELTEHMRKEEQVLFPMIRELESGQTSTTFHCGSVSNPIRQMDLEHEQAGIYFLKLRQLTDNYSPPPHACFSYRAMLTGLEKMEQDLQEHMEKESGILFPKVLLLEQQSTHSNG